MRRSLILLMTLTLAAVQTRAQVGATTDIITGTVVGPDNKPIAGATVEVTSVETEVTRKKTTNDQGKYTLLFPDGGGQYRISVRHLGDCPSTRVTSMPLPRSRRAPSALRAPTAPLRDSLWPASGRTRTRSRSTACRSAKLVSPPKPCATHASSRTRTM